MRKGRAAGFVTIGACAAVVASLATSMPSYITPAYANDAVLNGGNAPMRGVDLTGISSSGSISSHVSEEGADGVEGVEAERGSGPDFGIAADLPEVKAIPSKTWQDGSCTVDYYENEQVLYIYPTAGDRGILTDWENKDENLNGQKGSYLAGTASPWMYEPVKKMVIGRNADSTKTGTVVAKICDYFFGSSPIVSQTTYGGGKRLDARVNLSEIEGLDRLDVSQSVWFVRTFCGTSLMSIDIPQSWSAAKPLNISGMFASNAKLAKVDAKALDTSNVYTMADLFNQGFFISGSVQSQCYDNKLTEVDVTGWDTSKVENFGSLFNGCTKLKVAKGIEDFKTPVLKDLTYAFANVGLESIDLSGWDVSGIGGTPKGYKYEGRFMGMFRSARSLRSVDISGWRLAGSNPKTVNAQQMFGNCTALSDVNMSDADFSNIDNIDGMFNMDIWNGGSDWVGGPDMTGVKASLRRLDMSAIGRDPQKMVADRLFNNGTTDDKVNNDLLRELILSGDFEFGEQIEDASQFLTEAPEGMYWLAVEGGTEKAPTGTVFQNVADLYKYHDAQIDKRSYTIAFPVSFDANGGAFSGGGKTANQHVKDLTRLTEAPVDVPVRDGFVFTGWHVDEAGTQAWDASASVSPGTVLYAGWKELHTVTFDAAGGAPTPMAQQVTAGSLVVEPDAPVRDGYVFKGWYPKGSDAAWDFASPVESDITLIAKWERVPEPPARPGAPTLPEQPVKPQRPNDRGSGLPATGDAAGAFVGIAAMLGSASLVMGARRRGRH